MTYYCLRATWFLVPEGSKISDGFPVERGLESLLTQRYNETLSWINKPNEENSNLLTLEDADHTIVEKIVPLLLEDNIQSQSQAQIPTIQLHDPQAPDISKYFLVFRQGFNDYARLCIEKKNSSSAKRKDKSTEASKAASPALLSVNSNASVPDLPAVLPLDSVNPISATSTVLSASVSTADMGELQDAASAGHTRHETHSSWNSAMTGSPSLSTSPVSQNASTSTGGGGPNGSYYSFRLYRTYASFYHTLGSGSERGRSVRVQTQRQTSELEGASAEIVLKEPKKNNNSTSTSNSNNPANKNSGSTNNNNSNSNNSALDAAAAWKGIKAQSHTFRGHSLPSPEIPCDLDTPVDAKYVIFVVHGVGQRAWRKMGFHFNKDCDEMRNILLDAAQARGLPPGSVVVLPVSWRAELNLAGNFTFGECEDDEAADSLNGRNGKECKDGECCHDGTCTPETAEDGSPKIDKDLKELSESLHTQLDTTSAPFQRGVSVFEGQFTQILERLALESIPAVRTVLSDATMDILLYVSQKHFQKILGAVIKEVIRLHRLFAHWNPAYTGEFSFAAHSLGSALVADLLSLTVQPDEYLSKLPEQTRADLDVFMSTAEGNVLPFKVDKFFAFGSPLGVFHLLKHTKPIGCLHSPHICTALEERGRKWMASRRRPGGELVTDVPAWTVYNCRLFYNVFHPHDPVAHRFESLTLPGLQRSHSLAAPLKIPYHKSGLTRFKMDLEAKIARAKDDWAKFKFSSWFSGSSSSSNKEKDKASIDAANPYQIASPTGTIDENPLAAFNHHFRRVDFSLQDSVMENAYISALGAHFVYWSDLDIAAFIVSELIKKE